ncbi:MAG: beta-lactamase family protein [Deltaproteobacteria bacterium]|nr:beta-lactamase family protein [Deltaproteobacteria bacterium]
MRTRTFLLKLAAASALLCAPACGLRDRAEPPTPGAPAPDAGAGTDPVLPADAGVACSQAGLEALELRMGQLLDQAANDPGVSSEQAYTLMLEREDGRTFVHSQGGSSPATRCESASTAKWVTATVILDLVDQGKLALSTSASARMPLTWKDPAVTLEHLLSFRSGYAKEPLCLHLAGANFRNCVQSIYEKNAAGAPTPGTRFEYSGTHLQVAGLMAIQSVPTAQSWGDVFSAFKARTGLFPDSTYDLPSATNPRLGGGMHWTAQDYFGFLRALYRGTVLSAASRSTLMENHRGAAVPTASPVLDRLGEDWAYGLGNWLECPGAKGGVSYDCGSGHRNSSPGAYGAYPFIDFDHQYFGILARQGAVGTFHEGVAMFRSIQALSEQWAANACPP